ncbi:MAG: type 4a pilus biogenesis protein PilO [Elusimicrobia bacterium]|nr:type 4a pilus biogenesis protein PilO [Candidatus Liberimonas magnetica]
MTKQLIQKLVGVGIFIVFFVIVYFKYLAAPLDQKYRESSEQLNNIETKVASMKQKAKELPKLQKEMKLLEEEVAELGKRLPKEKGIQELLRIITKDSQNYHLNVLSFSPNPVAEKSNYFEIPFRVSVKGTYHSLAQFLSDLGQESRIISAKNLEMSADTSSKNNSITASFSIIAYTFKG